MTDQEITKVFEELKKEAKSRASSMAIKLQDMANEAFDELDRTGPTLVKKKLRDSQDILIKQVELFKEPMEHISEIFKDAIYDAQWLLKKNLAQKIKEEND